jgi:hypothetical protein
VLNKVGFNLLAALLTASICEGEPVTYLIMTLRMNGFGGERVCRGIIDDLKGHDLIKVEQHTDRVDRRTKTVALTSAGREALQGFSRTLEEVTRKPSSGSPSIAGVRGPASAWA